MKKTAVKSLGLFLFLFMAWPVQADFAKQVEQKYDALASWSATFVQTTYIEMLKETVEKSGLLKVKRPNGLHIAYHHKGGDKIYASDGKDLYIYKTDDTIAYRFKKPKKVISKEALSFLSGLKNLSTLFDVLDDLNEHEDTLKIKDRSLKKLFLVPREPGASVLRITLGIDAKDMSLKEAVLYNASGNITHYAFSDFQFNPSLADSLFQLPDEPKRKIIKK